MEGFRHETSELPEPVRLDEQLEPNLAINGFDLTPCAA